jgi:hypothetical protein
MGWIAGSYLVYLLLPMVLLSVGSIGRAGLNAPSSKMSLNDSRKLQPR